MKLKNVFLIFLTLFLISSCATFKPLISKRAVTVNGIFNANYRGSRFDGFFSVSGGNLRMDVVNSFGFSVYGIYVKGGKVFIKDYQTGKVYYHLKRNGIDFDQYKNTIEFVARNFLRLCGTENPKIVVLRCKKVKGFILPDDFILREKSARLRITLKNIKVLEDKEDEH